MKKGQNMSRFPQRAQKQEELFQKMLIMEYIPLNKIKTNIFRPSNKLQDTIPKKTELYTSYKYNM